MREAAAAKSPAFIQIWVPPERASHIGTGRLKTKLEAPRLGCSDGEGVVSAACSVTDYAKWKPDSRRSLGIELPPGAGSLHVVTVPYNWQGWAALRGALRQLYKTQEVLLLPCAHD